jgi:hypothetical protein
MAMRSLSILFAPLLLSAGFCSARNWKAINALRSRLEASGA